MTQQISTASKLYLNDLTGLISQWAEERNIIKGSTPQSQTLKLGSEFGELCDNIAKGRYEASMDDIGDMFVVITILCEQLGFKLSDCVELAYNEIKDRKGRMENGVFVKEGDMK